MLFMDFSMPALMGLQRLVTLYILTHTHFYFYLREDFCRPNTHPEAKTSSNLSLNPQADL